MHFSRAKPKLVKIPAQIEEEAKAALEPEELENSVVVNSPPQVAAQTNSGSASPAKSTTHNSMSEHLPGQCQDCGKLGQTHYDNCGSFYSSAELCTKCIVKRYQPKPKARRKTPKLRPVNFLINITSPSSSPRYREYTCNDQQSNHYYE